MGSRQSPFRWLGALGKWHLVAMYQCSFAHATFRLILEERADGRRRSRWHGATDGHYTNTIEAAMAIAWEAGYRIEPRDSRTVQLFPVATHVKRTGNVYRLGA